MDATANSAKSLRNYSTKEAWTLARNASRGAYLTWGLAEEAAYAVGWLIERKLPSLAILSSLLERNADKQCQTLAPTNPHGIWHPASSAEFLCPVVTGALLTDSSQLLGALETVQAGPMACPALFLPFVAAHSTLITTPLNVRWHGFEAVCSKASIQIVFGADDLLALQADMVTVTPSMQWPESKMASNDRTDLSIEIQVTLTRFASRLLVPESEDSREDGAG